MNCPKCCREKTRVTHTRHRMDECGDAYVLRRRTCPECGTRFTSYECYELADVEAAFKIAEVVRIMDQFRSTFER